MTPFVLEHPGTQAEAPADPLASFLADVANAGRIAVRVESMEGDPDELWALAGEAEAAGLVERWPDAPKGPSVVLTALTAARLGLTATSDGRRWLRQGEAERRWRPDRVATDEQSDAMEFIYANAPDPDAMQPVDLVALNDSAPRLIAMAERDRADVREMQEQERRENVATRRRQEADDRREARELWGATRHLPAAERAEQLRALEDRQREARAGDIAERMLTPGWAPLISPKLPTPRELVGLGIQWPPPVGSHHHWRAWLPGDGPCPGCAGRPLGMLAVCLVCHRAGLDGRLPPVERDMMPRPPLPATADEKLLTGRRPVGRPRKAAAVAESRETARLVPLRGGLG